MKREYMISNMWNESVKKKLHVIKKKYTMQTKGGDRMPHDTMDT